MAKKNDALKNLLFEVERHCNNYFNPRNDPNDPKRNYPPAFLELVGKIETFLADENGIDFKSSFTSFSEGEISLTRDLESNSWQKLFSRELGIYKRAKFI